MNSHTGDPLAVGHELFGELLLDEIVDPHVALRGYEEVGPDGVEGDALHHALVFAERVLRAPLAHLVDQYLEIAVVIRHDAGQVVAFAVPSYLSHSLRKIHGRERERASEGEGRYDTEVKGQSHSAATSPTLIRLKPQRHPKTKFMAIINTGFGSTSLPTGTPAFLFPVVLIGHWRRLIFLSISGKRRPQPCGFCQKLKASWLWLT